jgi:hypothetical protein
MSESCTVAVRSHGGVMMTEREVEEKRNLHRPTEYHTKQPHDTPLLLARSSLRSLLWLLLCA